MVKPITPNDASLKKQEIMPDEVIETWNRLIAKNWDGSSSRVLQNEAVEALMALLTNNEETDKQTVRRQVFQNKWLDIEPIYRNNGWSVIYDKPAYNESYEAFFVFKSKNAKRNHWG